MKYHNDSPRQDKLVEHHIDLAERMAVEVSNLSPHQQNEFLSTFSERVRGFRRERAEEGRSMIKGIQDDIDLLTGFGIEFDERPVAVEASMEYDRPRR